VLQHNEADYQGDGTGAAYVRLPLTDGIQQAYASSIPNRLGVGYALTPPSAAYSPKLYDPRTDTWYGETGYPGGWYGGEYEVAGNAALGTMFSGSDRPITVWGDHRPTGEAATTDAVWSLEGTTPWHHLRLEVPPNRYAYGRRRDDAAADGTSAERLVATASGVRRLFGDYFTGLTRRIFWADAISVSASQNVGTCTWTGLYWGGQGADWPVQGAQNALFVSKGYYAPGSAEDLAVMAWLDARFGVAILTPPATPPEYGAEVAVTVLAPLGVQWTLSFGGYQVSSAPGLGEAQALTFFATESGMFAENTAILSLQTADGRDDLRIAVVKL